MGKVGQTGPSRFWGQNPGNLHPFYSVFWENTCVTCRFLASRGLKTAPTHQEFSIASGAARGGFGIWEISGEKSWVPRRRRQNGLVGGRLGAIFAHLGPRSRLCPVPTRSPWRILNARYRFARGREGAMLDQSTDFWSPWSPTPWSGPLLCFRWGVLGGALCRGGVSRAGPPPPT